MSSCKYVTMNKAGTLCWGKSQLGKSGTNTDRKTYVKPAGAFAKAVAVKVGEGFGKGFGKGVAMDAKAKAKAAAARAEADKVLRKIRLKMA